MATALKNLSDFNPQLMPDASGMKIAIVVAEWNEAITFALRDGAVNTLLKHGVKPDDIAVEHVPGTFELTAGAKALAQTGRFDAVIVLGCVIQGETRHFDFICQGVTQGITQLNLNFDMPFIFGVLTTDNQQQAIDRAGGKHGNKGDEAAYTAIKMVDLIKRVQ
ncbi:MAG: 6,7-dimethyl-8-ribityllumazine synthase [Bacteroidota bacterium]|nr:MAG: 6,7-dimethyl-8-ribityllumazine synthase [Bacteroidota bacterium]